MGGLTVNAWTLVILWRLWVRHWAMVTAARESGAPDTPHLPAKGLMQTIPSTWKEPR